MENKQSQPNQAGKMDQKMKSTKEAIDKAHDGQKKQSAQKHYQAAEKAKSSNNESECVRECDTAMKELHA